MNKLHLLPSQTGSARILQDGRKSLRLKASFLIPLALILFSLMLSFSWLVHNKTDSDIAADIGKTVQGVDAMLRHQQGVYASMLAAVSRIIRDDELMQQAMIRQDRAALLKQATPVFEHNFNALQITHLYFHTAERINLLRLHQPELFGDRIDRFTLLEALATDTPASGLELGELGTLSLRHVEPWHDPQGRLIGFIEVAMEIDNIFESIKKFYHTQLYLLIHKAYLKQDTWQRGMRLLGREGQWDLIPRHVIVNIDNPQALPEGLLEQLVEQQAGNHHEFRLAYQGRMHAAAPLSVSDVNGRDVGELWVLVDIQQAIARGRELSNFAAIVAALLGIVLFVLFYRRVTRVEDALQRYHEQLLDMATLDGLTNLYNRKSFDTILASEVSRAQRYNRPLSLLLLDVDQFKEINDTYGHPAGDMVLEALALDLANSLRTSDHAARYGGDEFAIILSETSHANAMHLAERIRRFVERQNYFIHEETLCKITLSIGVAACSKQRVCTEESLLKDADRALYTAKYGGRNRVHTLPEEERDGSPAG